MRALIGHSPHPLNGLLALLAETGIRIGEALALDTNSIRGGLLTVDKNLYRGKPGPPKTDTSYRSLSLSGHLAESLAMLSERQGAILFRNSNDHYLWPGDVAGVMRDKVALSAQLEWRGFHAFRRGNVSLMRQLGVSPTIRLYREGHSPKGNFLEARYDQNIGLTPLERQEEKQWAEKIGQEIQGDQENG
jgi:integrase